MKNPVDHISRPLLPWRPDESAITECGYDASKVSTLTREAFFLRVKEMGQQRTAILTCMTCMDTAKRWQTWQEDPRKAIEREIAWECVWGGRKSERGERLLHELKAIAKLIENHREEFNSLVDAGATFSDKLSSWLEMKAKREGKKT